jgi:hypothetical protein
MARVGISTLIGDIDAIANNLKGRLGEPPLQHLVGLQSELEAWLVEARALERQQELDTGQIRRTSERRRKIHGNDVELRGRATTSLQGLFGKKAKDLHDFGLRPRRDPRPAKSQPSPEPTPQPTSSVEEDSTRAAGVSE